MTPEQAAKACVARIRYCLVANPDDMEREFTEIISQVTPAPHFEAQFPSEDFIRRWPYIGTEQLEPAALRAASEQRATCSRCGCDGTNWDHQYGCPQATHANALSDYQGGAAGYNPADLQNALPERFDPARLYRLNAPPLTPEQQAVSDEINRVGMTVYEERFPQEIVEPQPKSWWRTLWAYVLNREP